MTKRMISLLGISLLGISSVANAGEKSGDLKSSATMQATCLISANQIGFGAIATPLLTQSANSEMTVKCSNTASYTIDLIYGGIYGTGVSASGYDIAYTFAYQYENKYTVYDTSGVYKGDITCGFAGTYRGKVAINTIEIANFYGYNKTGIYLDTKGACVTNDTRAGTYPKNWVGVYNLPGNQAIGGTVGYTYGVMNGMSKGDKLAYSIAVPGDPNKVWNKGNNSYSATGIGDSQTITLVAKIVPDKSGSKYPAPDMYLDTITAVISY